jgi:hypothetical protein
VPEITRELGVSSCQSKWHREHQDVRGYSRVNSGVAASAKVTGISPARMSTRFVENKLRLVATPFSIKIVELKLVGEKASESNREQQNQRRNHGANGRCFRGRSADPFGAWTEQ